MAGTKGCYLVRVSESHKAGLSSDWSLQLDSMKLELLVIPDQHAGVNTFPGLVHTARRTKSLQHPKPVAQPFGGSRRRWGRRFG